MEHELNLSSLPRPSPHHSRRKIPQTPYYPPLLSDDAADGLAEMALEDRIALALSGEFDVAVETALRSNKLEVHLAVAEPRDPDVRQMLCRKGNLVPGSKMLAHSAHIYAST